MPAYVRGIYIDWHYNEAPASVRKLLPEANERLSSTDHTFETFGTQLRELATRDFDIVADALVEDAYRRYWLFRVRPVALRAGMSLRELGDARVTAIAIEERLEDGAAIEVPYDNALDDVPLEYADEDAMHAELDYLANELDEDGGELVVEAGHERFVVKLAPGSVSIRKLVIATERDLVTRLLRHDYASIPAPPRVPDQKYEQLLFLPASMLKFIQDEAMRTDHSLSWIVQFAFKQSRQAIAASDREQLSSRLRLDGPTRRQSLYFPGDMLDAMEAQAARLDSSVSLVTQSAVALAKSAIRALPAYGA